MQDSRTPEHDADEMPPPIAYASASLQYEPLTRLQRVVGWGAIGYAVMTLGQDAAILLMVGISGAAGGQTLRLVLLAAWAVANGVVLIGGGMLLCDAAWARRILQSAFIASIGLIVITNVTGLSWMLSGMFAQRVYALFSILASMVAPGVLLATLFAFPRPVRR